MTIYRSTVSCFVLGALVFTLLACTKPNGPPQLPPPGDINGLSDTVLGAKGSEFLSEVTNYQWSDGGRRAAESFGWISGDARGQDADAAERAGKTAHALASFLADQRAELKDAPSNPALWRCFSDALSPYLGAMVGDDADVRGFEALDRLGGPMLNTTALFGSMTKDADASSAFTDAAAIRAQGYEQSFAEAVTFEPALAPPIDDALRAARLRSLIATGAYLANSTNGKPAPFRAQTQLAYEIAKLTASPRDPTIGTVFFDENGRLIPPNTLSNDDWSLYDSQISAYLSRYPQVSDAIRQYGREYQTIAAQ